MSNLVLCGFMGCGKSTVGRLLAARCGMTFVDTDAYLEEQLGQSISSLFATEGEAVFRAHETAVCRTLGAQDGLVLATGGGAVLRDDCTRPLLQRPDKEDAVRTLLHDRAPLYARAADITVDAEADPPVVVDRLLDALHASEFLPKCPC